ncbi:transcriptional regulator [Massilia sp. B-10]|nr:transcriptional regulator [Massilia sp. B-10]UUZ53692.1 transcriptional regulator [Massilia sp. H-1]
MDTHKKIHEHISTLSDGELAPADLELALAALHSADGQQAWNTYHRIGDVLRAQATPELSEGFADRLAARLAAERRPCGAPPAARPPTRGAPMPLRRKRPPPVRPPPKVRARPPKPWPSPPPGPPSSRYPDRNAGGGSAPVRFRLP